MALVACPECSRAVSERARTCPGCGYPIARDARLFTAPVLAAIALLLVGLAAPAVFVPIRRFEIALPGAASQPGWTLRNAVGPWVPVTGAESRDVVPFWKRRQFKWYDLASSRGLQERVDWWRVVLVQGLVLLLGGSGLSHLVLRQRRRRAQLGAPLDAPARSLMGDS